MPDDITLTLTLSRAALTAAVDAILREPLGSHWICRDIPTLTAVECTGNCEDIMAFLRAARDAGIDLDERIKLARASAAP